MLVCLINLPPKIDIQGERSHCQHTQKTAFNNFLVPCIFLYCSPRNCIIMHFQFTIYTVGQLPNMISYFDDPNRLTLTWSKIYVNPVHLEIILFSLWKLFIVHFVEGKLWDKFTGRRLIWKGQREGKEIREMDKTLH